MMEIYLDPQLGPAGLRTCSIEQSIEGTTTNQAKLFSTRHELSSVIPSSPMCQTRSQVLKLNCNSSPHLATVIKDH